MTPTGSDGETGGAPRYWLLVITLLAINTYAFIDRAALALLVEPIKRDLLASDLQMGLLLGFGFAVCYGVFSIPAGYFIDRHNRRAIIGAASILWATMTIVCGTATSIEQLFIGRAGVGIAESVISPAAFSLIRDAVPQKSRGLAFSLYAMAPLVGGAMSLLVGGHVLALASAGAFAGLPLLGALAPWQCTLVLIGAFGLPLSLSLLLVAEPKRPPAGAGDPLLPDGIFAGLGVALGHIRKNLPVYVPLILFVTLSAMTNFSKSGWEPALIGRTWGLTPQQAGPLLGGILLTCGISGLLFSGFLLNWLTRRGGDIRTYGIISTIGAVSGLVGMGLAPSLNVALVMDGIASFFMGTAYSVGASTLGQVTPVRLMGRVTAIYFLFQSLLGQALGPFLVAFGSQKLFIGRTALADSFALCCALYGATMIVAVVVLRRQLRLDATRAPAAMRLVA